GGAGGGGVEGGRGLAPFGERPDPHGVPAGRRHGEAGVEPLVVVVAEPAVGGADEEDGVGGGADEEAERAVAAVVDHDGGGLADVADALGGGVGGLRRPARHHVHGGGVR